MYKITNKKTGFIQYRNKEDATNFIQRTKGCITDKYKFEKIKEIDGDEIQDILYAVMGGICLIILICIFFTPNF